MFGSDRIYTYLATQESSSCIVRDKEAGKGSFGSASVGRVSVARCSPQQIAMRAGAYYESIITQRMTIVK
jgi:hypothetical protein